MQRIRQRTRKLKVSNIYDGCTNDDIIMKYQNARNKEIKKFKNQ